jgi:hypothetical protein
LKKEGKHGVKPSSTVPVRQFDTTIEPKGMVNCKRIIGNCKMGILPDPLPPTAKKILSILGANGVQGEAMIAAKLKAKSTVSRWAKCFLKAGALIEVKTEIPNSTRPIGEFPTYCVGSPKYYMLTPYGSKLLTGGDGVLSYPILLEDYPLLFKVERRELAPIPWKPLGNVNHWRKQGIWLAGVTVELHDGLGPNKDGAKVMIHPGHVKGFNVDDLLRDSAAIIERVRGILMASYGIKLSEKGELQKNRSTGLDLKPCFRVYHPDVRSWMVAGSLKVPGEGAVDHSPEPSKHGIRDPLSNEPHAEYFDKRNAALLASLPPLVSYDPAKQTLVDGFNGPKMIRETRELVSLVAGRIDVLTKALAAQASGVDSVGAQVGGVVVELRRLADTFSKLENLESLPKIAADLQLIVGVLSRFADLEKDDSGSKNNSQDYYGGKPSYVC